MKLYNLCILNILAVLIVSKTFALEQIHPDIHRVAQREEQGLQHLHLLVTLLNSLPSHQPHSPLPAQRNPVNIPASQPQSIPLPVQAPAAPITDDPTVQVLRMPRITYNLAIATITGPLLVGSGYLVANRFGLYRPHANPEVAFNIGLSCSLFPIIATCAGGLFVQTSPTFQNSPTIDIPYWKRYVAGYVSLMGLNTVVWSFALSNIKRH